MTEHVVTVRPQLAWGEVLATCQCGWIGSYKSSERQSRNEADRHLAAHPPLDGPVCPGCHPARTDARERDRCPAHQPEDDDD